jgi:hypothetical protein
VTPEQHAALPARERLAKTLLARVHGDYGPTAYVPNTELYTYVTAAEDTIEQQAAMLAADTETLAIERGRRQAVNGMLGALGRQCDRLKAENALLRHLVEEAIAAGAWHGDGEAITTIRTALEATT